MYVNCTNGQYLNARQGAGTSYAIKYYVPHGQSVTVRATSGDWKKIVVDGFLSKGEAWVQASYLQTSAPTILHDQKTNALGNRNLSLGMFGRYVHNLQLGLGITADGDFGSGTKMAVENFQRANPPLGVDGIVGPLTMQEFWNQKGSIIVSSGI